MPTIRVLVITSYFPLPANQVMATWALLQAQALARRENEVEVVAPVAWIPAVAGKLASRRGARRVYSRALAPALRSWGEVTAHYPRWPVYEVGPHRRMLRGRPAIEANLAWAAVRRPLCRLAEERRFDVVLAHGSWLSGYVAMRLGSRLGLPFVTMDHDYDEISDCDRLPARRSHYRRVSSSAAVQIAVSKRMERDMQRLFEPHETAVLHMAADPPPVVPPVAHGASSDAPVIFSAGGFYPRKNFPSLVAAFGEVAQRHPRARLRIAGDGQERPAVEQAIARLHLEDRVELLGFVPHVRVLAEMATCDVFALPSRNEPCGTVFMEAMAAGRPIVWSSDGGIADVVTDGVQGLAVDPTDRGTVVRALDEVLGDAQRRDAMGQAARDLHVRSLTWEAAAEALEGVLRSASASRSQVP